MEKGIFINTIDRAGLIEDGFQRVYFGTEFCQELFPGEEEIRKVADLAAKRKLSFTLVTPFFTEGGLERIENALRLLSDGCAGLPVEVVANDWGVLELISRKYKNLHPVIGRLLSKKETCPIIEELLPTIKKAGRKKLNEFSEYNINIDDYYVFLKDMKVERIDSDSFYQVFCLDRAKLNLKVSFYYPYLYLTTTRFCYFDSESGKIGSACKADCLKNKFILKNSKIKEPIYLIGNTQFFMRKELPPDLEKLGCIDRLVYCYF